MKKKLEGKTLKKEGIPNQYFNTNLSSVNAIASRRGYKPKVINPRNNVILSKKELEAVVKKIGKKYAINSIKKDGITQEQYNSLIANNFFNTDNNAMDIDDENNNKGGRKKKIKNIEKLIKNIEKYAKNPQKHTDKQRKENINVKNQEKLVIRNKLYSYDSSKMRYHIPENIISIAHRGYSSKYEDNSWKAFKNVKKRISYDRIGHSIM